MKLVIKNLFYLIFVLIFIPIVISKDRTIYLNKARPFRLFHSKKVVLNNKDNLESKQTTQKVNNPDLALEDSITQKNTKSELNQNKSVLNDQVNQQTIELPKFEIPIRVLLETNDKIAGTNFCFESENGFLLLFSKNKKRILIKKSVLNLRFNFNKKIIINGRLNNYNWDELFIIPINGNLDFRSLSYKGFFLLAKVKESIFLVNQLDLEDYVGAVLHAETWPTWPSEVNCALSICIRSYAISKILEQRTKKLMLPYDIKNTTAHQVYNGVKESMNLKNVIEKTRGLVLGYNKKPILAMFDISCGGVIPAHLSQYKNLTEPLSRSYKCTYCKNFKCFKWQQNFTLNELQKKLKQIFPKMGYIKSFKVAQKDKAGIPVKLKIETTSGDFSISSNKLKTLLKLKSNYFSVATNRNKVTLDGKGFGHLIGLCQFGLYQMIKDGWNFKDALKFYYPKTNLIKLINK